MMVMVYRHLFSDKNHLNNNNVVKKKKKRKAVAGKSISFSTD